MIIKEVIIAPNSSDKLYRIYSNNDFYLRKGDILYTEVIEAQENSKENYIETTIPIPEKIINSNTFYQELVGNRSITESVFYKGKEILHNILQTIPVETLYHISFLLPEWTPEKVYNSGDKVFYKNRIYEATDTVEITPPDFSSAFKKIEPPQDLIEEWDNSYSKTYRKGDKVKIGTHIYTSLIDDNIWSPLDFPAAWQLIDEGNQD